MARSTEARAPRIRSWRGTQCPWLARLRGVLVVIAFVGLGGILARLIPADEPHDLAVELRDPRSGPTITMSLRRGHRGERRCGARAVVSFRLIRVDFAASRVVVTDGPSRSIPNSDHVLVVDEDGHLHESTVRIPANLCQELVRILLSRDSGLDFDALARRLAPPGGNLKELLHK